MISCERINWICHFVGCISHHMLRLIAVNMKYLLPATRSFSNFVTGRVGYLKKRLGWVGYRDPVRPCLWKMMYQQRKSDRLAYSINWCETG